LTTWRREIDQGGYAYWLEVLNDGAAGNYRGMVSSLRNGFLGDYDVGRRALVVRHAAEASSFVAAEYNKAFVLMEYFGYLRREIDQGGYDYWLEVLNNGAVGNYRGMVCAFLTSTEYQLRFSTVVTRSNAECGHENVLAADLRG
jgi:hypothetical protein